MELQYEDKFVGFIDILGFKDMVIESELGQTNTLSNLLQTTELLGTKDDENKYKKHGPLICPNSKCLSKDLNIKITQISDCVIISTEVSPAGIINLISHSWNVVLGLLMKGVLCRGYITKGKIYHQDNHIIGSGYQNAYKNESSVQFYKRKAEEKGTPFVEIDGMVCDYINNETDPCVKDMFHRFVETKDGFTAIFPIKNIGHSFSFHTAFDVEKEKASVKIYRDLLTSIRGKIINNVNKNNKNAMRKIIHYIEAIDNQIANCNRADIIIEEMGNTKTQ